MELAAIGIPLGVLIALAVSRIASHFLMMINTFDGVSYVTGTLLALSACLAAAYFPARRAARIDPVDTLRHE